MAIGNCRYVLVEKQLREDGTEGAATVWKYFVQDELHNQDQFMFIARKVRAAAKGGFPPWGGRERLVSQSPKRQSARALRKRG